MIKIEHISKTYKIGEVENRVLKDVSISVNSGDFVSVYGRSGSGKTTLMQIIGCLDMFDSGKYQFEKLDIKGQTDQDLTKLRRDHIGFIFQTFNLISTMTVYENIEYPLLLLGKESAEYRDTILSLLKDVGLEKHGHHFPSQLSGGQRQRAAIARALVKNPKLIIADEPTANLDDKTSHHIVELICHLQSKYKTTVVCSSHDSLFLKYSIKTCTIVDGVLSC
nr:ABC transporter ATP-binding protein [Bdellovibrio sp. HAGR004]